MRGRERGRPGNFWQEDNMEEGENRFCSKIPQNRTELNWTDRARQENHSRESSEFVGMLGTPYHYDVAVFSGGKITDDDGSMEDSDTISCRSPLTMTFINGWWNGDKIDWLSAPLTSDSDLFSPEVVQDLMCGMMCFRNLRQNYLWLGSTVYSKGREEKVWKLRSPPAYLIETKKHH